jgi:ferredoxin
MRVIVDRVLCEGNARCVRIAPAVFALEDDVDTVRLLVEEPGEELREAVENAVATCPRQALKLSED